MKTTILSLLTLAALTITPVAPATASVVIDSTGGTYAARLTFTTFQVATVFTAGIGGVITDLKLAFDVASNGSDTFSAALRSVGPSNTPTGGVGGILASVTLPVTVTAGNNTLYDFTSLGALGAFSLIQGTQYALTFYGADSNNIKLSQMGPFNYAVADGFTVQGVSYSSNNGATFNSSGNALGSFNMQLSTVAAAVPEPSTYALLCISLGVVGYARKKMMKPTP